ncbi:MAG: polysaccharide biosynthesis protein [Gammaproteobacteria bacterium]
MKKNGLLLEVVTLLQRRSAAFLHDLFMVPVAWMAAYWIRFNLDPIPTWFFQHGLQALVVVVPIQMAVFWFCGLYRGVWRFASMPDLMRIVQASVAGALLSATVLFMITRLHGVPRSVLVLYAVLLIGALGAPRFIYRWFKDYYLLRGGQRVVVLGAGQGGDLLVRDLMRDARQRYRPVAFLDDDPNKLGLEIHGVRVLGGCDRLGPIVDQLDAKLVMIAIPSAGWREMKRMVQLAEATGLPVRTLPGVHDVMAGRVGLQALRDVSIEDLLGRQPVALDWGLIRRNLTQKVVLVTGGGGSIGSELCRQVARLGPESLVVVERSEFSLYDLQRGLAQAFPGLHVHPYLCDVCDADSVRRILKLHRPSVVFHAAGYKHVPLLESQLREAVRNNVLGTRNVCEAVLAAGVDELVLISTDKAVNPVNVMGATKRIAELVCGGLAGQGHTRIITVRFGNVLGSAGSVVPLFREQIAAGGPVTVTHRDVVRYFMTIPEACQLIMQAGAMGRGGEVFVLDMGEPVKVAELAEQMIRLAGKVPGEEVPIVYTGLRPGEKLYEELFYEQEVRGITPHSKILLAKHRPVHWPRVKGLLDQLERAVAAWDEEALPALLKKLVPELNDVDRKVPVKVLPLHAATADRGGGARV